MPSEIFLFAFFYTFVSMDCDVKNSTIKCEQSVLWFYITIKALIYHFSGTVLCT